MNGDITLEERLSYLEERLNSLERQLEDFKDASSDRIEFLREDMNRLYRGGE